MESETVTTPLEGNLLPVDKTSVSKTTNAVSKNINTCSKNITKNKKSNTNRRRKRSYRKNSGNKFNKNRDVLQYQQSLKRLFRDQDNQPGLVPYNTNSFLMQEHYPKTSPNFITSPNYNRSFHAASHDSSSRSMSGSDDDFLTKEFRLDYENLRLEQLQSLSKEAVIQEILKLENSMEMMMKAKENEIQALNNKIKGGFLRREGNLYVKFLFPSFLESCRIDTTVEA